MDKVLDIFKELLVVVKQDIAARSQGFGDKTYVCDLLNDLLYQEDVSEDVKYVAWAVWDKEEPDVTPDDSLGWWPHDEAGNAQRIKAIESVIDVLSS